MVQANNRTTGAAMGILMISGVKNHLSDSRNKTLYSSRPVGQADRANPFEIEPDGTRASRLTFAEDFTLEHSLPGLRIASIGISDSFLNRDRISVAAGPAESRRG
jgi:hypothetical protein